MPYVFIEYPKWLHADGRKSVLVGDAEAEAAQLAAWAALDAPKPVERPKPAINALTSPVAPKGRGGWPKGKPRSSKQHAMVN